MPMLFHEANRVYYLFKVFKFGLKTCAGHTVSVPCRSTYYSIVRGFFLCAKTLFGERKHAKLYSSCMGGMPKL